MVDRELLEADLDDYVIGDSWPIPNEDGTPPPLADEQAAQGVMRRLAALEAEKDKIVDVAQGELDRITLWRDDRVAGIERDIAYGKRALEDFARTRNVRPKGGKRVTLPNGHTQLTKTSATVEITDPAAFMVWACGADLEDMWVGDVPTPTESDAERKQFMDALKRHVDEKLANVFPHFDLLKVTYNPSKDAIKRVTTALEEVAGGDGITRAALVVEGGEEVPGVEMQRPTLDRFGVTLSAQ